MRFENRKDSKKRKKNTFHKLKSFFRVLGEPSRVLGEPIEVPFKYTRKCFWQVFYVDERARLLYRTCWE
jgi:hypothetical protein